MADRWGRLAPLTGVLFGLLIVAALIANSSYSPKPSASAASVVSWYTQHRSAVERSGILFAFAYLVLVLFAGATRAYLRRTAESLGALVLAGGILMAVGGLACVAIEYGLAHNVHNLSPEAAKTLNLISAELFLPARAGEIVFALCGGLAIIRGAGLPMWLGWLALAIGVLTLIHMSTIVTLIPHLGFYALFAFVIWSALVGILMCLRSGVPVGTNTAPPPYK
jgi:hypothetical protein